MSTAALAIEKPSMNGTSKKKIENNVYKTSDYSIFKRITGNREINLAHVKRLKESMKHHDLMIPIIVNELMQVVDGQHRLEARKELGIPVYYVLINGLNIHDTQKANINNKNWTSDDFLNYYCEQNYYHYKEFRKFKDRFGFNTQICIALLAGTQGVRSTHFNSGEFGIDNLERAVGIAEMICRLKPYYKGFRRRSFVFAMLHVFNNGSFEFEEFINKVSYQSTKMVDCTTVEQYLALIEDIYNYKRKPEDKVRFRA